MSAGAGIGAAAVAWLLEYEGDEPGTWTIWDAVVDLPSGFGKSGERRELHHLGKQWRLSPLIREGIATKVRRIDDAEGAWLEFDDDTKIGPFPTAEIRDQVADQIARLRP